MRKRKGCASARGRSDNGVAPGPRQRGARAHGVRERKVARAQEGGTCQRHAWRGRRRETLEPIASGGPLFANTRVVVITGLHPAQGRGVRERKCVYARVCT